MAGMTNEDVVTQYAKASAAHDVDALRALRHPDWTVFWPQCHTEKAYRAHNAFGRSGFPFTSKEYTDPESVDFSKVEILFDQAADGEDVAGHIAEIAPGIDPDPAVLAARVHARISDLLAEKPIGAGRGDDDVTGHA